MRACRLYYVDRMTYREVAEALGFANEGGAKRSAPSKRPASSQTVNAMTMPSRLYRRLPLVARVRLARRCWSVLAPRCAAPERPGLLTFECGPRCLGRQKLWWCLPLS